MSGPPRILIVDDEAEVVGSLKEILGRYGYEVLTALNGMDAVDLARAHMPNLILLDLMLPTLDGYRVLKLLKSDERYRDIPVVVITARADAQDWALALECGADACLTKPVNLEMLLQRVQAYVRTGKTDETRTS